jgi:hypothetical protein
MLLLRGLEEGDNIEGHALGAPTISRIHFFNRQGSDGAICCRTRCNRHNRDCNGPSRKDCIAAVSGRPHERGQYDSLFL